MEGRFSNIYKTLTLGLLLIVATTLAVGQGISTGSISGTIEDEQHAVVSGAKVTATQDGTGSQFNSESNSTGYFTLRGLPVGTYTVAIEAQRFSKLKIGNVAVTSGLDNNLGARALKVGAAEVVTVEGGTPMVETGSSQVTTSFNSRKVAELPIGSNFDQLALLVPGMVDTGDNTFSNSNGVGLSSNGQRGRSNNFQIDGQSNNDNSVAGPSLFVGNQDVIQEFQVINNNFSAEYGRNMGSVINYVTKSGTNGWHGTGFEFYTGNFTDSMANDDKNVNQGFCFPAGANPNGPDGLAGTDDDCTTPHVPRYVRNRFGGTFGGPIYKDKAWFFVSGLGDRIRTNFPSTSLSRTPTPQGLVMLENAYCGTAVTTYTPNPCPAHPGLGSLLMIGPYSRTVGDPHPSGSASFPSQLRTVTANGITVANVPFRQISRQVPNNSNDEEFTGRVDWQISPKDRFFARYFYQFATFDFGASGGRSAAGAWVALPTADQQIGLDYTRNFTTHFINQVRFSYSFAHFVFAGGAPFPTCTISAVNSGCPTSVAIGGGVTTYGLATNLPQDRIVKVWQYQDNATYVLGKHTLKFGGEYSRQNSPNNFLPNTNGSFSYSSFNNLVANPAGSPANAGSTPTSDTVALGPFNFNFQEDDGAFYFQDDWKVRDNLTLNLGIRWEFTSQAINLLNDITTSRESNPATGIWFSSIPLNLKTIHHIPNDTNNWGPNFGFAYTPRFWQGIFGHDKTVFRGGYRIAYDPSFYNIFANVATAAPVVNLATLSVANIPGCAGPCAPRLMPVSGNYFGSDIRNYAAGFIPTAFSGNCPATGALSCNPGFRNQTRVDDNFHNPYTQQYSFGMERQITSKIAAEVRYAGNHTVGNFQSLNENPRIGTLSTNFPSLVPAGLTPCTTANTPGLAGGRINCGDSNVRLRSNTAWSTYNALQSRLDIQNWHGLTAGVAYTYSRTIDNVSEIFSTSAGGTTIALAQNPFNTNSAERGLSGISFPHVTTVNWIYDLPWYKNQNGAVGHLLGGWQVNGIYRFNSGQPYNLVSLSQLVSPNANCDNSFSAAFFGSVGQCLPYLGNPNAPIDSVGIISDPVAGLAEDLFNCGVVCPDVPYTQFHWIYPDSNAATFFKTPYSSFHRNRLIGQTYNSVDFGVYKNTKITENTKLQFQLNITNLLNRQFVGTPDPFIEDCPLSSANDATTFCGGLPGSFQNTAFNTSNRRRMTFGLRFIF